ncbi:MAG TPA: hypothetical protein V6C86_01775 [Oculatellaceae cyanobacterium]
MSWRTKVAAMKLLVSSLALLFVCTFVGSCFQTAALAGLEPKVRDSKLYGEPQLVEIIGYSEDAMEPCVSPDGRYLFFNNSNEGSVDTHVHFAERVAETKFRYLGILEGSRSLKKDMAPTMTVDGHIIFTTLRSFDKDHRSLYCGIFKNNRLTAVAPVSGNLAPSQPFWIDMDCGVDPAGQVLVVSRAQFLPFQGIPGKSDLFIAHKKADGSFMTDLDSDAVLKTVNSAALEYAPAITADGLELYFTRAGESSVAKKPTPSVEIFVSHRRDSHAAFREPRRLAALEGFVEAPSLTMDKKELYFHKKDSTCFHIYRALRSGTQE